MSTKIYDGRLLDGGIGQVYDLLMKAKPELQTIARDLQIAWMARRAVELCDDAAMRGEEIKTPLHQAWIEMQDRRRIVESEKRRDPAIDFDFELWLFPQGARSRTTLAIANTGQRPMMAWFDALPFVHEYGYWDNSDRPDTETAAQWARRRRDWDEALPGAGVPSERCLSFVLSNGSWVAPTNAEDALRHAPGRDKRLARLSEIRHGDECQRMLLDERRKSEPDYKPEGFELYFKARQTAAADPARRAVIAQELSSIIGEVTVETLQGRKRG